MPAVTSPITHAQMDGGAVQFRQAFVLFRQTVLLRLQERMSVRGDGALVYLGDLAGSGSDTIRTRYYNGIGYGAAFASVAETATPGRSSITAEVEDVTVGRFYLGYSQTYMDMILKGAGEKSLIELSDLMADAWEATWMALLATTISAAAVDYGASGVNMTFDDYLDVIAYFRTLDGFEGPLRSLLHGQQFVDFGDSIRAEPAFQQPEPSEEMQRLNGPGFQFELLGCRNFQSNRITSSGGNRHGGFFGPGAMAWAIAGTQEMAKHIEDPDKAQVIPELGMVVERSSSGNGALGSLDANAFLGMDINDDSQLRGMVTDA